MFKNIRHIALLFILLLGVLSNVFASNLVHDASKISIEKRAIGDESIKAWGALTNLNLDDAFRRNVDYLDNISKHSTNNLPPNTFGRNDWAAFFAEHEDKAFKIYDEINSLNAHELLIHSAEFLDDFYKSAQKISTLHEASGPMVGKVIGHAFSKHGSHNTKQLLYDAIK